MNKLRELIKEARIRDINILSVEVDASTYKELKKIFEESDLYATEPSVMCYQGVKIIGKLCTCGAHPEDYL